MYRLSALLQIHPHSRLKSWLQRIGQRQLQYKTGYIYVWGYGAAYIWGLTVYLDAQNKRLIVWLIMGLGNGLSVRWRHVFCLNQLWLFSIRPIGTDHFEKESKYINWKIDLNVFPVKWQQYFPSVGIFLPIKYQQLGHEAYLIHFRKRHYIWKKYSLIFMSNYNETVGILKSFHKPYLDVTASTPKKSLQLLCCVIYGHDILRVYRICSSMIVVIHSYITKNPVWLYLFSHIFP